ncbi:MAG: Ig-like domain-containing protein [Calditrichaeota bacterium]|nr:Ig-like domain-containing protein [Calditrichota bacterium]MCB9366841.1 Ig-like domain-containing protein [Calditrichota bacterium]
MTGQTVEVTGLISGTDFSPSRLQYFISDPDGGPWSGLLVFDTQDRNFVVGDSVVLRGLVQESNGQTRLNSVELLEGPFAGPRPIPTYGAQSGGISEEHEGVLVELSEAVVTEINSTTFTVNDGSGPLQVREGFEFGYEPFMGDTLQFLRGIIEYRSGEFVINPRNDADFGFFSNRPPIISNVSHTPERPTGVEPVTVTAMVTDDNNQIAEVRAYYRFGTSGDFQSVQMFDDGAHGDNSASDGVFGGILPAGPERSEAFYYVRATDTDGAAATSPDNAPTVTYSYFVRSINLSIFDVQFVDNPTGGDSPYNGQIVTLTGIVTGTNFDGGSFFMSDPGGGPWSGVLVFNPTLTPAEGDCVSVTARVQEYFGLTELSSVSDVTVIGTGVVPLPDTLHASMLPDSSEAYEGGFVHIGACVVTDVSDFGSFGQWTVRDATGEGVILGDFGLEYVPTEGDSFTFIQGCVSFNSNPGHMIAPRYDTDMGIVDRRAPQLVSAESVTENRVNIRFNERISPASVNDLAHFQIVEVTNPEFPALHILSALLFTDGKTIQIEVLESLPSTSAYELTVTNIADVAGNALESASFGFGGYFPNEVVAIADIYTDFAAYDQTRQTLRGVVNFVQDVTTSSGSRRISAFIQDNSGRGFSLSQTGAASTFPGVRRGNLIEITGLVNEFGGAIQLGEFASGANSPDVRVIAENMPLPTPIEINTGDLRLQSQIIAVSDPNLYGSGTWCVATGTAYQVDENVGGGTNIFLDDGSGNLTIRVWDSMELDSVFDDGEWIPLGELVGHHISIAGPSSSFNGDFQMLAGYADDFVDPDAQGAPSGKLILEVPNRPFAPEIGQTLHIFYDAPPLGAVRLRLFNLRGQLVHTFVDKRAGGPNALDWDGRNDLNEILPLGTYILHLESIDNGNTDSVTKPIVVGTRL